MVNGQAAIGNLRMPRRRQPPGFASEKHQNTGKAGLGTWAAPSVAGGSVKLTGVGARRKRGRINRLRYIPALWLTRP